MRSPIIVALDVPNAEQALALTDLVAPAVGALKVGKELFVTAGPDIVRRIGATGAAVFLDLKFHDIPNTVARAVECAVALGVDMLTVHASGGAEMLRAAEEAAQSASARLGRPAPLVLGVTVLTSLDDANLLSVGVPGGVSAQVERLARLAVDCGLRGLVCSPLELPLLRRILPRSIQLVTPGIRPAEAGKDDQKRTLSPAAALAAGADWLVIGRPITAAPDPRRAAEAIQASLNPSPGPGGLKQ
jgi:orotidine-5'-phosphate decarboxylase